MTDGPSYTNDYTLTRRKGTVPYDTIAVIGDCPYFLSNLPADCRRYFLFIDYYISRSKTIEASCSY